jgi:hypothetical protein
MASMKTPALIRDEMEGVLKERILVHKGFYGKNERKLCKTLYVCVRVFPLISPLKTPPKIKFSLFKKTLQFYTCLHTFRVSF